MPEHPLDADRADQFAATGTDSPIEASLCQDLREGDYLGQLSSLLDRLEGPSIDRQRTDVVIGRQADNELVRARLGIASTLFTALRVRSASRAAHALRVALCTSMWATQQGMADPDQDRLEVAALLHDVGMIGVPDEVLLNPGPLTPSQWLLIRQARAMSVVLLRSAGADETLLEIVEHVGAWYDGSRGGFRLRGDRIPLAARMITIVEAFDAMTSDHVYRSAMSVEEAVRELFNCSGTQFDPVLVVDFVRDFAQQYGQRTLKAASRWLQTLVPEQSNSLWLSGASALAGSPGEALPLFPARMLENMRDAAIFVDVGMRIVHWNPAAERLTGISAASVLQRLWTPQLLELRNEKGHELEDDCPVRDAIAAGMQSLRRLKIRGRSGKLVTVDSHAIPVIGDDGATAGAVFLLHDASPETSLEQRCQSLHEQATKDPLTQVANRAEFDRVHAAFIEQHRQHQVSCSLIICDLDHFKQVNDTYGHQAGDEAIKTLARLLRKFSRPGDLVARYGGEEFVMLCADCDNATAARRADQIRVALSRIPHPKLNGRAVTASFGVTEVQPGDTPETMLRRADRALLMAKSQGRNRVVQLGVGAGFDGGSAPRGWRGWFSRGSAPPLVLQQDLITPAPVPIAVEKLRGFISDHRAKVISINANCVRMELMHSPVPLRRRSDRPVVFTVELELETQRVAGNRKEGTGTQTCVRVTISPRKNRDRRRQDVAERAREVLASLRSYLMASPKGAAGCSGNVLRRAGALLAPWLAKRRC